MYLLLEDMVGMVVGVVVVVVWERVAMRSSTIMRTSTFDRRNTVRVTHQIVDGIEFQN